MVNILFGAILMVLVVWLPYVFAIEINEFNSYLLGLSWIHNQYQLDKLVIISIAFLWSAVYSSWRLNSESEAPFLILPALCVFTMSPMLFFFNLIVY